MAAAPVAIVVIAAEASNPIGWVLLAATGVVLLVGATAELSSTDVDEPNVTVGPKPSTYERSQPKEESKTTTTVSVVPEQKCPRPWSVRIHAQGTDIGGTSGSTIGAPPLLQQSPISKGQGLLLADATFAMLTKRQGQNLALAYGKCCKFISTCGGFLGSKSFYGLSKDNNRFDVDSYGPTPNFVN